MLKDLIQKIVVVLSLEYLGLFSAEVVLPGVITTAFNINILLGVILVLVGVLIFLDSKSNKEKEADNKMKNTSAQNGRFIKDRFFIFLIAFLLAVNIIALYKVSIGMMLVYTVMIVGVIKLLWKIVLKI